MGKQKCVNSSYFWQSRGIYKIQLYGEAEIIVESLKDGSIIDVKVEFDEQCVQYWHNEVYQGCIKVSAKNLVENQLYPGANLR